METIRGSLCEGETGGGLCLFRAENSGVGSATNYIARKYGVRSYIPLVLAKRRLRRVYAAFLPVDYGRHNAVSDRVMRILRSHADILE